MDCHFSSYIVTFKYLYYCNTYVSTKTIKDVDEMAWRKLKVFSAEHGIKMGKLLEKMTEDYEKRSKDFWKLILSGEKILSDKEAEEMKEVVKKLRKERGFR